MILRLKLITTLGVICILGTACNNQPTATPPLSNQTWIDKPLDGSTIPLAPYQLLFHAASPKGVSDFEVSVNGAVVDTVPPVQSGSGGPDYGTLFLGDHTWTPLAPGTYLITVRARPEGGEYGSPAFVQVSVFDEEVVEEGVTLATATPTEEIAQLSPPEYSEENLYYGRNGCGSKELSIRILASHPEIQNVLLFYRLSDTESEAQGEWTSRAMNPASGDSFIITLHAETDFPDYRDYKEANLQVQFVALDSEGEEITRTDVLADVIFEVCLR